MSHPSPTDMQLLENAVSARVLDLGQAMEILLEASQDELPLRVAVERKIADAPLVQQRWQKFLESSLARRSTERFPRQARSTSTAQAAANESHPGEEEASGEVTQVGCKPAASLPTFDDSQADAASLAGPELTNEQTADSRGLRSAFPADEAAPAEAPSPTDLTQLSAAPRSPIVDSSPLVDSAPTPPPPPLPQASLTDADLERYELLEEIGRGGCGIVYRAFDRQLQRDVVVKRLIHHDASADAIAQRFFYEAKLTGRLTHPGIVPVYELGESCQDGSPYYAMKWLQGETLSQAIASYHQLATGAEKQRRLHQLLESFIQVCQTIAYAHQRGIIHRDLKPSNIMLGAFGETIVLDWGLGKELHDERGEPLLDEVPEVASGGNDRPRETTTPATATLQVDSALEKYLEAAGRGEPIPAELLEQAELTLTGPAFSRELAGAADDPSASLSADASPQSDEPIPSPRDSAAPSASAVSASAAAGTGRPRSTLRSASENLEQTRQGMVLGTAAYMAPEQAMGRWDQVDRRSDIFSLGVVLSEILLGRSPLRAEDVSSTIARVVRGEYRPIRTLNRRVPKPLAAICDRAMSHSREGRYADAQELARDLQSYLAGEAVQAYQEPWWGRVDRLLRRNRTLAWSGLLSAAVISLIASVAYLSIHTSHRHEQAARFAAESAWVAERRALRQAQEAHSLAMEQLRASREAGDSWLIDLSQQLAQFPQLEPLRSDLQQNAQEHFRQLTEHPSQLPTYQLEIALAHLRVGDLLRAEGKQDAAADHFRQALAVLQELGQQQDHESAHNPLQLACDEDERRMALANTHLGLALVDLAQSPVKTQPNHATLALQQLQQLSPALQDDPDAIAARLRATLVAAHTDRLQSRTPNAIARLEPLVEPAWELATEHELFRYRRLWELLMSELAELYEETGQVVLHRQTLERHRAGLVRLGASPAKPINLDRWQADLALELGESYRVQGVWDRSREAYDEAVQHFDRWLAAQRLPAEWLENAWGSRTRRGIAAAACGAHAAAEEDLRTAIAGWRELIQDRGATPERAAELGSAYLQLGRLLMEQQSAEAAACLANARELGRFVVEQQADEPTGHELLFWSMLAQAEHAAWEDLTTDAKKAASHNSSRAVPPAAADLLKTAEEQLRQWQASSPLQPGKSAWLLGVVADARSRLTSSTPANPSPLDPRTQGLWQAAMTSGELPAARLAAEQLTLRLLTQSEWTGAERAATEQLTRHLLESTQDSAIAKRLRSWHLWRTAQPRLAWEELTATNYERTHAPIDSARELTGRENPPLADKLLGLLILRDLGQPIAEELEGQCRQEAAAFPLDWPIAWLLRQLE